MRITVNLDPAISNLCHHDYFRCIKRKAESCVQKTLASWQNRWVAIDVAWFVRGLEYAAVDRPMPDEPHTIAFSIPATADREMNLDRLARISRDMDHPVTFRLDHDVGSKRSRDTKVIDFRMIEHDVGQKPVPAFWHPARDRQAVLCGLRRKHVGVASSVCAGPGNFYRNVTGGRG